MPAERVIQGSLTILLEGPHHSEGMYCGAGTVNVIDVTHTTAES